MDSSLEESGYEIKGDEDLDFPQGVKNLVNAWDGKFADDADIVVSFIGSVIRVTPYFYGPATSGKVQGN